MGSCVLQEVGPYPVMQVYGSPALKDNPRLMKGCWVNLMYPVSAAVPSSYQPKKQSQSLQWILLSDFPYLLSGGCQFDSRRDQQQQGLENLVSCKCICLGRRVTGKHAQLIQLLRKQKLLSPWPREVLYSIDSGTMTTFRMYTQVFSQVLFRMELTIQVAQF